MTTVLLDDEARYLLEENEVEINRLHLQHYALKIHVGLFNSPIEEKLKEGILVLDSGCGPAAWTSDMAKTYPNSKFIGIDITSSVFPEKVLPNCEFIVGNIAENIPFPDNTFEFIHQRLLLLALSSENWDKALKELYRVLKPGGYIEFAEVNVKEMSKMGPLLKLIQDTMSAQLLKRGMVPDIALGLKDRINATGFVNQNCNVHNLAVKSSDLASRLNWEDYSHVILNLKPIMALSNPEWEDQEVYEKFVQDCGSESEELGTTADFYYYRAQKPLN